MVEIVLNYFRDKVKLYKFRKYIFESGRTELSLHRGIPKCFIYPEMAGWMRE